MKRLLKDKLLLPKNCIIICLTLIWKIYFQPIGLYILSLMSLSPFLYCILVLFSLSLFFLERKLLSYILYSTTCSNYIATRLRSNTCTCVCICTYTLYLNIRCIFQTNKCICIHCNFISTLYVYALYLNSGMWICESLIFFKK